MILRITLAFVLAVSFALVAAPTPAPATTAVAADACETCPASREGAEDCADDCPLCVCGPHRAPMTAPPATPSLDLFAVAEFSPAGDPTALSPTARDILHVPRLHPALPQS